MTTTPSPSITVIVPSGTSVGPWNTSWTFSAPEDVWLYVETDGVAGPDLALGVDFTLNAPNPGETGGAVTLAGSVVPVGGWDAVRHRVVIRRWTPRRQGTALPDTEGHKPRATERALDRQMRIAEEQDDEISRLALMAGGEVDPALVEQRVEALLPSLLGDQLDYKVSYDALSAVADPAGGAQRLRLRVNVEAFRTGDRLTEFETQPGRSNAKSLQAAIDALSVIGGGTVELPPGDFLLSNPNLSTTNNERFAVELKPWVRIDASAATIKPDATVSTVFIFGRNDAPCHGASIIDGYFDCTGIGTQQPVKPSGAYQYFGGCGIAQRNGPRSEGVLFDRLFFEFPDVDPSDPVVPYHSCVMQSANGVWSNATTPVCGGDCYQFNGGFWRIDNPDVGECADGGLALNNGFEGVITGGSLRRCNLGIGGGPYGLEGDSRRSITIRGTQIIEPNIGMNFGWYGLASRVAANSDKPTSGPGGVPIGADTDWPSLSPSQKASGDFIRKAPPKGLTVEGVQIVRPKSGGFWFIAGAAADYGLTVRGLEITECGSNAYGHGPDNGPSSQIAALSVVGANRSVIQNNVIRDTITPVGGTAYAYVVSGCAETEFERNASFGNAIDALFEGNTSLFTSTPLVTDGVPVISGTAWSIIATNHYFGDQNFLAATINTNRHVIFGNNAGLLTTIAGDPINKTVFGLAEGDAAFKGFKGGFFQRGYEMPRRSFGTASGTQGGYTDASGGVAYAHGIPSGKERILWAVISIDTGVGGPVVQILPSWDGTNIGFASSAYPNKPYILTGEYAATAVR
ncbi:hypothetical protein ACETK8_15735 [Brevundimonas staleyi]|uniref:Right-handed parallel beta-helix repeat-containing protein n=1 Tax=Brevundimonas staleyi TaxID=74326 RepID=A0ABW0FX06_9CAUL